MFPQRKERADYFSEFWSLIQIESELMMTVAYLRVLGSLPEGKGMTIIAYWAGYEFTLLGLEPREGYSAAYAEVASSVCSMAAYINNQEWEDGCQQAAYELNQLDYA